MKRLLGTLIFCRRCGAETRSDMVRAELVNELRAAASAVIERIDSLQDELAGDDKVAKLRKLC
jgi:hypothetical protein